MTLPAAVPEVEPAPPGDGRSAPRHALNYCAASFCCFVTDHQAALSAVAFLPVVKIPLLANDAGMTTRSTG